MKPQIQVRKKNERKTVNNKFDELAKGLAQSVTRRQAFKKFGVSLAGMALACFGLVNKAEAGDGGCFKQCLHDCLRNGGTLGNCQGYCWLQCSG
jgi:hypothetical protein